MADVQFPTNNFDATHGGVQPDSTPNTDAIASNNYGRERTAPTLYSDNHYTDGDGLLYALGKVAQRVLVKTKDLDPAGGLMWYKASGESDTENVLKIKLYPQGSLYCDSDGLDVDLSSLISNFELGAGLELNNDNLGFHLVTGQGITLAENDSRIARTDKINILLKEYHNTSDDIYIDESGLGFTLDNALFINAKKGLYVGQHASGETGLYINLYHKDTSSTSTPSIKNASGLAFVEGSAHGGASASTSGSPDQLTVQLETEMAGATGNPYNISGLKINTPSTSGSGASARTYSGGLEINKDSTLRIDPNNSYRIGVNYGFGLKIHPADQTVNTGKLDVDTSSIVDTDSFSVPSSGDKADKITLKAATTTTLGGVKVDNASYTGSSFGNAYPGQIGIDSSTHEIAVQLMSASDWGVAKASAVRQSTITSAITGETTSGRYYGVEIDQAGKLFVNVPWENNYDTWRAVQVKGTPELGTGTNTGALNFIAGTGTDPEYASGLKINLKPAATGEIGGIAIHGTSTDSNSRVTTGDNYYGLMLQTYNSLNKGYIAIPNAGSSTKGVTKLYDSITVTGTDPNTVAQSDGALTPNGAYQYIKQVVADLSEADWHWQIMASLPTVTDANYNDYKTVIALILHSSSTTTGEDIYDEYVCIRTGSAGSYTYKWEKIGSTGFITDNFVQKTDVLTATEINSIVADVFGF